MNPFRSIKDAYTRYRARGRYEQAQARVKAIQSQIYENKRKHKAWVPLLGSLTVARNEMLRAELDMGRR